MGGQELLGEHPKGIDMWILHASRTPFGREGLVHHGQGQPGKHIGAKL